MAKLRSTSSADKDYQRALLWYRQQNRRAAEGFRTAFRAARRTLAANPTYGVLINTRHRAYLLHKYPYLVIYYLDSAGDVNVVAIVHAHRDPATWIPTNGLPDQD